MGLNINRWSIVPFICLKTCFAYIICFAYSSLINCDNFVTIKHKSDLVVVSIYQASNNFSKFTWLATYLVNIAITRGIFRFAVFHSKSFQ